MAAYRFGAFRLDPARRVLARDGRAVELPPKAFDVIVYLVEHRERAVGRDELIAGVWGRVDVSDNVLDQIVSRARKALGDAGAEREFIATRPRFGFAWVAAVDVLDGASPVAAVRVADAAATGLGAGIAPPVPMDTAAGQAPDLATDRASATTARSEADRAPGAPGGVSDGTARRPPAFARYALLAAAALAIGLAAWWGSRDARVAPVAQPPGATQATPAGTAPPSAASTTLVAPFDIAPEADAAWARLGLMELVAQRLRAAGVATLPSDNAIALTRGMPEATGDDALRELARRAGVQRAVQGRVAFVSGQWRVALRALAVGSSGNDGAAPFVAALDAVGEAATALDAARLAADRLAVALGRTPAGVALPLDDAALALRLQQIDAAVLGDALDSAQASFDALTPAQRAHPAARLRAATLRFRRGDLEAASAAFQALLDDVSASDDPRLRGTVLSALGNIALRRGDAAGAEQRGEQAIAVLGTLPPSPELGRAYTGRAIARSTQGEYEAALGDFAQARLVLEGVQDRLGVARVDINAGILDAHRGRFADAAPRLAPAADRLAAFNDLTNELYARVALARVHLALLDPAAARAEAARLATLVAQEPNAERRRYADLARAEVLHADGRLHEAGVLLAQVRNDAGAASDAVIAGWAQGVAAQWRDAADARDPEAAREAQAALNAPWADEDERAFARTWLVLVRQRVAAGETEGARAALTGFEAWATQNGSPMIEPARLLARAALAPSPAAFDAALAAADASRVPADLLQAAQAQIEFLLAPPGDTGRAEATGGRQAAATERAAALGGGPAPWTERAGAIAGRLAPWAERDYAAARLTARVHAALGHADAAQAALANARRLAGERDPALPATPPSR